MVAPSKPNTVGEIISSHHWRDARNRARIEEQAFRSTPLGAALTSWKNALANAWQTECREHVSDKALNVAWEREEKTRREFRTLLTIALQTATTMKIQFTKTFLDYHDAALWLHAHGYSEAVVKFEKDGRVTITLEGQHAVKAIEQATNSKVKEAA